MRVLLVDDEQELVSTLAERLAIRGIKADWETDVEEALKRTGEKTYDLAVLDMKMPKMDGIELKKQMEIVRPAMKFIFMTGYGSEGTFKAGILEASDNCYLLKPVNLEILVEKMKEILDDNDGNEVGSNWELIGERGFQFYGKMSASISHEIKNVLAIINENAGLLKDLVYMAEKGSEIDPKRLQRVSDLIAKQVNRADSIVKNMNTFAHSVDDTVKTVDTNEIIDTVIALSSRFADMKGVVLEWSSSEPEVGITTKPFLLENLLWLCLDFAMDMAGSGGKIGIRAQKEGEKALISFSGLVSMETITKVAFPGEVENALIHALSGEITVGAKCGKIDIRLPTDIS
jgi:DNA-binding response OmpR family regulator